jgi:hypothetical protein
MSLLRVFLGVIILSLLFARPISGVHASSADSAPSASGAGPEGGCL